MPVFGAAPSAPNPFADQHETMPLPESTPEPTPTPPVAAPSRPPPPALPPSVPSPPSSPPLIISSPNSRPVPSKPVVAKADLPPARQTRQRRKERTIWVRTGFLGALAITGAIYGLAHEGILNLEPILGNLAITLGVGMPEVTHGNTVKLASDGVAAALEIAPTMEECAAPLRNYRHLPLTPKKEFDRALNTKLTAFNKLDECLRRRGALLKPGTEWVQAYFTALAAYTFAADLDRLPPEAQKEAREMEDEHGVRRFDALLYANQAMERFNDARPDSSTLHQSLIDGFLAELDGISLRARGNRAPAEKEPAKPAESP
jgi:hypothetical protein